MADKIKKAVAKTAAKTEETAQAASSAAQKKAKTAVYSAAARAAGMTSAVKTGSGSGSQQQAQQRLYAAAATGASAAPTPRPVGNTGNLYAQAVARRQSGTPGLYTAALQGISRPQGAEEAFSAYGQQQAQAGRRTQAKPAAAPQTPQETPRESLGARMLQSLMSGYAAEQASQQAQAEAQRELVRRAGQGLRSIGNAMGEAAAREQEMQLAQAEAQRKQTQDSMARAAAQSARNESMGVNAARGTESVLAGIYDRADNRASSLYGSEYAQILRRSDYAANSRAGESRLRTFGGDALYDYINDIGGYRLREDVAQARGMGNEYGKYAFMTEDEVGVYNYLYATEGKRAANAYLAYLEPELDQQWYSGVIANTTELVNQNTATRAIGSLATVAAQPARTLTSLAANAEDLYRTAAGKEINPYSGLRTASRMTQDIRQSVAEDMSPVGSFVYQTAMSAGDSAVNAIMAQGIAGGVGAAAGWNTEALMQATNVIGSVTMSSEVMSMAVAENKQKGYSDAGALSLGLLRGAIEYASEAIGGEWVIRNVEANPLSLVKTMVLNMIPEGAEEVMSDAANEGLNLVIDQLFGTQESFITTSYDYFRESGTAWQRRHPGLATALAALWQEAQSFAGGALATVGSSAVQYGTQRQGINRLAQQLGSTPEGVVQLMRDTETENVGTLELLTQLSQAKSLDELRERVQETRNARDAIDAAMRERGEAGRAAVNTKLPAGERLQRALDLQRQGAANSEIFNQTGLVVLANGTIQDGIGGPILSTGGQGNDKRADAADDQGVLRGEERPAGEAGGSREENQRLLRPERSWNELTEQNRTAAAETVRRHIESSDNEELTELREAFRDTGGDPDAEIARRIYQDLQTDPIVAENNWGSLFGDINGLLAEMSREGGDYEQRERQSIDQGSENRDADQRAGGQAGAEADQADAGAGSRGQGEVSRGVRGAGGSDLRNSREVTPAELGIPGGAEDSIVTVLDPDRQSGKVRDALEQVRSAGLEPVAFAGEMRINGVSVNGYIQDGRVYFRTDAAADSDSIVKHELFHHAADSDPGIVDAANEIIRGRMSREAFLRMEQQYFEAYKDLYQWESMEAEDVRQRLHEEIAADAYAGMNGFAEERRTAEAVREEIAQRSGRNTEAEREIRGPDEGRANVDTQGNVIVDEDVTPESVRAKLQDIFDKKNYDKREVFPILKNTPRVYIEYCHLNGDASFVMQAKKANKSMQSTVKGQHALGVDGLAKVIENLGDPEYIIYQNSGDNAGHYVAIISIDEGETVAAVDLGNYRAGADAVKGENGYYNVLITAFKADSNYINNTIFADENDVIYDRNSDRKNEVSEHVAAGDSRLDIASDTSFNNSIRSSSENSNTQNKASVEVAAESTVELLRELRAAEAEYDAASERNDAEYDFRGQLSRIRDLEQRAQAAMERDAQEDSGGRNRAADPHPERGEIGKDGVRVCRDTEALEAELNDIGGAKLRDETGEYMARIRRKNDGGYLASVDRDGKRDISRSFGSYKDAAAFAAQYVQGQINAREDAELDRERSAPIRQQGALEALFTGKVQDEAERLKKNKAAEAATQTLKERIRRREAEIQELEKTTGLTEQQKAHKADLQQTLEILNDELTSRKGRARAKKKTVEAKGNKPVRSAAEAKNALMETFHTAQGERGELGKKLDQRLAQIAESGQITEQDRTELMDMLMDTGAVREEPADELKDVRSWLRGARIYVSEHDRADLGDNWNSLRKRARANGIYLTGNITDRKADSLNAELAETFGEGMFPTDSALSDMLSNMIDKAEAGRSRMISFADAIEKEARGARTDPQEIYNELSRKLDETLRTYGEKAQIEVDLKNRTASMLATERQRMEDRLEQRAQRRWESEIRDKTMKAIQRLAKLRGKAAPEVRTQIDEALRDIDTHARTLTLSGIEDLQALQRVYDEAKKAAGFEDDDHPGNFIRNPYVEERLARLSQKHISDMDIEDVIELGRVVAGLENTVHTQNKMLGEEFDAEIKEIANSVNAEVKASRGAKPGFIQKWFAEEHLSPRRFLDMLGGWKKDGAMGRLADSLEKGQTRMLDFQRRAEQSMDPFMQKKENRKWLETASGKKATWSTYGVVNGMAMDGSGFTGQSIEITPMMKIALYLHSLNEDNLRHIQEGGIRIPNKELYIKGKLAEAYAAGEVVKMQPQAVRAIASQLTQQEKTFAGYLQKFFNEQSKAAINEVSMQLDGFERAGVENYFPIETDRSFTKSDVSGEARARTVEGIGSIANERVHAQNPIRLSDAYDTFVRQVDNVGRYYGYAIPIRNFQAVNNFVFHEEGNAWRGSIKDTIERQWPGAESYITKMLQDLQGGSGSESDMLSRGLARLRSNLAGANLAINPSVAVPQVASYPGAAQAVGWDGLAAGLRFRKVDEKLIEKYTPLLWYRSRGYSTQEIGDAVSAESKNMAQKLLASKALNWIQGMDRLTVKRLWAAAEYRVSKDNPGLKPGSKADIDAGTDAYYQKVAEVFNRAVYDTQPNYTNMERAQILRSNSELTKMLTMYKTVPLQYYGMMYEAVGRLQAARQSGDSGQIAEARRYAANTFGGIMAANTIYVVMKALIGRAFRKKDDDYRDEEGNLTAGSVTKQLGKDLAETYAGSIIGGAEAYSLIDGWIHGVAFNAPEISPLASVEDIANDSTGLFSAIGDDDHEMAAKKAKALAFDLSTGFGLPVRNAESYLLAAIRWVSPETVMEYENMFGGIDKSDLKTMDESAVGTAANIILRNRTGERLDRGVTDELARLYSAGFRDAIPTAIPDSFTYNGETVEITDRRAYANAWGAIVADNLEELLTSDGYIDADDKTRKSMIDRLYDYATVQARKAVDENYSVTGNSTYGWADKADAWLNAGVPLSTVINMMLSNGEVSSFQITDQAAYGEAWNRVVNGGLKLLISSADYRAADDKTQNSMVNRLYQYATVQARLSNDPSYDVSNSSTYSWTRKADLCLDAGIELQDTIVYMTSIGSFTADKDENGNSISGSKKEKVVAYIDGLDLTSDQMDLLYLYFGGYKENSLPYTPWHNGNGKYTSGSSGRRRGSRRRSSAKAPKLNTVGNFTGGKRPLRGDGIDISVFFGRGSGSSKTSGGADASRSLLEIVNRYYDGNPLAAAMDGGRKARTSVDFKV